MFLLVPAYPGCPGSKAVKRSLLLLLLFYYRLAVMNYLPSQRLSVIVRNVFMPEPVTAACAVYRFMHLNI